MRFLRQMGNGKQRGWMRWIAVLCMLLMLVASTVEVCHSHPEQTSFAKGKDQSVPAPDHCPLCVAMHSALPAALHVAPEPVMVTGTVRGPEIDTRHRLLWAHGLASRPPPALKTIAL